MYYIRGGLEAEAELNDHAGGITVIIACPFKRLGDKGSNIEVRHPFLAKMSPETDTGTNGRAVFVIRRSNDAFVRPYSAPVIEGEELNSGRGEMMRPTQLGRKSHAVVAFHDAGVIAASELHTAKEEFVVRPYMVIDGTTYYGKPFARSMYSAAVAVRDAGYTGCDDNTKTYVDEIIANAPAE